MYTGEEHQTQAHWEVEDPPDPTVARNGVEFVGELRVLLRWSGLSFREIEDRAFACGGFLPEGAVAETLRNNTLPSEDLLVPLLWALGCDDDTVELWLWARERVAGHPQFAQQATFGPVDDRDAETALRHAVQERGDQGGWRGLHRQAGAPDEPYRPKRLRAKAASAQEEGSRWWSRTMIGMVTAGAVALTAGIGFAVFGGGDGETPPESRGGVPCCLDSRSPVAETPADPLSSIEPTDLTEPSARGRPSTTSAPRPTVTTQGPTTPTDEPPAPSLSGSADADCTSESGNFVVSFSVTATLSGAASGTEPRGRAGQGSPSDPFTVNGSGTAYTGAVTITVGPDAGATVSGSIMWTVAVTVGAETVNTGGSESFSCAPSAPTSA